MNLRAQTDRLSVRPGILRKRVTVGLVAAFLAGCGGSASAPTAAPIVTTSTTEMATTTTTVAPTTTTTIKPGAQFTIDACKKLETAGYESRKQLMAYVDADFLTAGGSGSGIESLKATCAPSVDRMIKAKDLEERRVEVMASSDVTLSNLHCDNGRLDIVVTNKTRLPIGLTLVADISEGGKFIETTEEPMIVWSLPPGESQKVEGRWIVTPTMRDIYCDVNARAFLADDSSADAALATSTNALLQSPDPAVFFPELWRLNSVAKTIDDPAVTEDLRSAEYDRLVEEMAAPSGHWPLTSLVVCPGTTRQPSLDLMSFMYFTTYGPHTEKIDGQNVQLASSQRLSFGVFRRGSDGQWRWLGRDRSFDSTNYRRCGTPGQTLAEV